LFICTLAGKVNCKRKKNCEHLVTKLRAIFIHTNNSPQPDDGRIVAGSGAAPQEFREVRDQIAAKITAAFLN
jgi:hypothetical protein